LIKRLQTIGLPDDIIELIKAWLKNSAFNVCIGGENLIL
jgi:hypothetical protein